MKKQKPSGYWTYERCHEEALKYTSRTRFCAGSTGAYDAARRNKWLDGICGHMISYSVKPGTWDNKNRCAGEAKKYNTRLEFQRSNGNAYHKARMNGWLDEICDHMEIIGSKYKRAIYAILLPDDEMAYVGLSYNPKVRLREHITKPSNKHLRELFDNDPYYELIVFDGWYGIDEAGAAEEEILNILELEYEILNINKTGGLGGSPRKWNKSSCTSEAKKYTTRKDFQTCSGGAYNAARKNKWLNEICSHMVELKKPTGYWTFDKCHEAALNYNTRTEFANNMHLSAYNSAKRNGWLDDICGHMAKIKIKYSFWNDKEKCRKEAQKYDGRTLFCRGTYGAYYVASKNGWLDEFFPPNRLASNTLNNSLT